MARRSGMPRIIKGIVIALLINGVVYPHLSYAYGLRTGFGKVILENVPIGAEYSMRRNAQFPLIIENNSDREN
jgi:hypothetical protein